MIITIDGPTASGKSTVAKKLAERLGIYFLSTGLMFRALAYLLIKKSNYKECDLYNPKEKDVKFFLDTKRFLYKYFEKKGERIIFDGIDITSFLKEQNIDSAASILSVSKMVRKELLQLQRSFSKGFDLVAEGRDTGTVVFYDADFKFFLTASIFVRANRWKFDQEKKGNRFYLSESIEKISERDKRDSSREIAPLKKADDAIKIDNSELSIDQTVQIMFDIVKRKEAQL